MLIVIDRIFIVDKCTTIFQLCTKIYKKVQYLTIMTILYTKRIFMSFLSIICVIFLKIHLSLDSRKEECFLDSFFFRN